MAEGLLVSPKNPLNNAVVQLALLLSLWPPPSTSILTSYESTYHAMLYHLLNKRVTNQDWLYCLRLLCNTAESSKSDQFYYIYWHFLLNISYRVLSGIWNNFKIVHFWTLLFKQQWVHLVFNCNIFFKNAIY